MIRTLLTLPFRIVAVLVAVPTRWSARLLRFSAVATFRTTRAAVRSSIVSFLLGIGVGWFLTTPTGRYAVRVVVDAVRGSSGAAPTEEVARSVDAPLVDVPSTESAGVAPVVPSA